MDIKELYKEIKHLEGMIKSKKSQYMMVPNAFLLFKIRNLQKELLYMKRILFTSTQDYFE